jgi:hypothetical protein
MFANLNLMNEALKNAVAKKTVILAEKGSLVAHIMMHHRVSHRQAYKMVQIPISTLQYRPKLKDYTAVMEALKTTFQKHPTIGFWQCHHSLHLDG